MTTTFQLIAAAGGNPMQGIIMMALLFVIMWVVMIRPQQKRAKELKLRQSSLKKGDNVVTIGGLHATVNAVSDSTVSLRLADGIFVKYDKTAIATVLTKSSESTSSEA